MEKSPSWEASISSRSQKFLYILLNTKVRYHIHKNLPLVSVLSNINAVPAAPIPTFILNTHFNNTLPSTSTSSEWTSSLRFHHHNSVCISALPHTCNVAHPSHFSLSDHLNTLYKVKLIVSDVEANYVSKRLRSWNFIMWVKGWWQFQLTPLYKL